jgi:hypothetical protein
MMACQDKERDRDQRDRLHAVDHPLGNDHQVHAAVKCGKNGGKTKGEGDGHPHQDQQSERTEEDGDGNRVLNHSCFPLKAAICLTINSRE